MKMLLQLNRTEIAASLATIFKVLRQVPAALVPQHQQGFMTKA
jgi:hypothetical protein